MSNNNKPQIIVKYKENADIPGVIAKVNKGLQNRSTKAQETLATVTARNLGRKMGLLAIADSEAVQEAVDTLAQDPAVEYAHPNYTLEALSLPGSSALEQQWALHNTGQTILGQPGIAGADLHLAGVWEQVADTATVIVGLIDTGVDDAHPDLAGRIEPGWDFYNDSALTFAPADSAHGTQIAGIIAAQTNGLGIVGAAPNARIMPLKCMENGIAYTSDIIDAITYAKNAGVKIINCSWGSGQYNPALKEAMAENSDLLFICAAGNDGADAQVYPAAFALPNVISVAAMNNQGQLAITSNYGSTVQLAAPGEAIYTTVPDGNYAYASGTSMAAAYATAAAAIYRGLNQAAAAAQIAAALQNSATPAFKGQILFGALNIAALLAEDNVPAEEDDDLPNLPGEMISLLNTTDQYSALNQEQQDLLCFYLKVQAQNMIDCEDAGLSLKESVWIAQLLNCLNLPVIEAAQMIAAFGDGKKAVDEAREFGLYTEQFSILDSEAALKELLQNGYPTKNIIGAYIASAAMQKDISAIIARDRLAELAGQPIEPNADELIIQNLINAYGLTAAGIVDYLSSTAITAAQLQDLIAAKKKELGLTFLEEIRLLAIDDQIASVPNAPFMYKTGVNELVNLHNGNLRHEERIAYLPGRNGLDLDLSIVYSSAESYSITGGDELAKWPVKSLGYGWSMNFTKQLRSGGLIYFRFTDGSTYQYLNGVLKDYKRSDITITNNNGAITLTYANGRKEVFDVNGNLTSIIDRFGNSINLRYPADKMIATGDATFWVKADGTVWACGKNDYGQLGDGTTINRSTPVQVNGLDSVVSVMASYYYINGGTYYHTVALKLDGTVWAWGYNGFGQLGDGTTTDKHTPVLVSGLTGVISVTAGEGYNMALKSDGTVWAWGNNTYGQLGDGTTINKSTPVQVSGLTGVISIGPDTRALKSDGTVWAWGQNDYGQLGDGTTINRLTPVRVSGLTDVISILAATMARKSDGTVWAWGNGSPVQVSGLTGVVSVSTSGAHTLALKTDGSVWAWGQNDRGQLGIGSTSNKQTPVQVSGLTGVVSVAAIGNHSIALKSDGTVWGWGNGASGQLGNGTPYDQYTPMQIPLSKLAGVISIAADLFNTVALKSDGTLWVWGTNQYGQLGDGTIGAKTYPVRFGTASAQPTATNNRVLISDTLSAITQIQYDNALKCYNIVLPDQIKTSLYLDSTSRLTKKVDALGRETNYSYTLNQTYNSLTNISYCTGLQSAFSYTYSTSGITGLLLTQMLCTDSGTNYLTENYAYSKETNTYTTTVTDDLGVVKKYVFDLNTHNKLSETLADNGAQKSETSYSYDSIDLPIQVNSAVYNTVGNSRTTIQLYEYDAKGNVTAYWGPLAEGVKTADYKVGYTYNSSYNILTGKTYNKDSGTSISEQYSLTEDSKAVSDIQIYESNVLKARTAYDYDQYGNVTQKREYASDSEYLYTNYQYQNGGYLIRKASLSSLAQQSALPEAAETYAYDACGRITSVTDANGNTEQTAYDLLGRIIATTHADGSKNQYFYQEQLYSKENSTTVTNERGYQTKSIFDGFGNAKQTIDLSSNDNPTLATYTYDVYLRLTEQTDGNGNKTKYSYDHLGRKTQKTIGPADNILYKETYEYNEAYIKPGEQSSYLARTMKTITGDSNAPSIVTFVDTDKMGNTVQSGRMDGDAGYTDAFTYNYLGHKISELTAQNRLATYAYYTNYYTTDLFGNVLTVCKDKPIESIAWAIYVAAMYGTATGTTLPEIKFNEVIYRYEYDWLSRKRSATDPKGNKTIYAYNLYSQLYSKETPFSGGYNSKETYNYDLNGNLTGKQITSDLPGGSGRLRHTEFAYNNRNRLFKTIAYDYDNTAYYTTYGYDAAGNKTSMTTGNGTKTTVYEYDARNRLFKETDPMGYVQTYVYDNNNNLKQTIDRNNNKTDNQYNALNKLTQSTVTSSDGKTQTNNYEYTATGSILKSANENLTTNYQYDSLGRMTKKSNSNDTELSYGYDLADNRTWYQLKANGAVQQTVVYTYDKLNRLTGVQENGVNAVSYTYDLNGNRTTATNYVNGVNSTYSYNNANLLTDLQNKKDAATISQCQYSYYLDGNQATKTENGVQTQYIYDGMGQLITEKETGGTTKQYTYNESGNRTKMDVTGTETFSTVYAYDANDRLTQEQTNRTGQNSQIITYSYDANGNQIKRTAASGTENRQYDGRNKITASSAPGVQTTYIYQADGLRLTKTVNGVTTTHVWDGQNIAAEYKEFKQRIAAVSVGYSHSMFLKNDGSVWACGNNSLGQLGDGTTTQRLVPVQVSSLSGVIAIAGNDTHSMALKSDGTVWTWGYNYYGQLGDGTYINRLLPVQVQNLNSIIAISTGSNYSLALKSDGTVWAWGQNDHGQLGDGTATQRLTPVQVSNLSSVTEIASGVWHSLALKSDGTVWTWGQNDSGQLGDGTITQRLTPIQVSSFSGVTGIAGGSTHSIVLKNDGTVWTWGNNDSGQLGDGTVTQRLTPVQVSGLNGVTAIACGNTHSIALKNNGTLWAWGNNVSGQLGDGTAATSRALPVQVLSLSGIITIAGGAYNTMALKNDSTLWAWGSNVYGQLGDGTTTSRNLPLLTLM